MTTTTTTSMSAGASGQNFCVRPAMTWLLGGGNRDQLEVLRKNLETVVSQLNESEQKRHQEASVLQTEIEQLRLSRQSEVEAETASQSELLARVRAAEEQLAPVA